MPNQQGCALTSRDLSVLEDQLTHVATACRVAASYAERFQNPQLKNVAAGTGRMDYSAILAFLKARKPYVQATLENTDDTNAVWAREHMESLYQQVN